MFHKFSRNLRGKCRRKWNWVSGEHSVVKHIGVVFATCHLEGRPWEKRFLSSNVELQLQVVRQSTGTCPLNRSDLWLPRIPLECQYGHVIQLGTLRCFVLWFLLPRTQLQPLARLFECLVNHREQKDAFGHARARLAQAPTVCRTVSVEGVCGRSEDE